MSFPPTLQSGINNQQHLLNVTTCNGQFSSNVQLQNAQQIPVQSERDRVPVQPLAQQPIFTNNSVRPVEQLTQQSNIITVSQNSMQMPATNATSQLLQNGSSQLSYNQPNTLLVSNSPTVH